MGDAAPLPAGLPRDFEKRQLGVPSRPVSSRMSGSTRTSLAMRMSPTISGISSTWISARSTVAIAGRDPQPALATAIFSATTAGLSETDRSTSPAMTSARPVATLNAPAISSR